MAIQIGGTTIINNSRNIENVGIVTVGSGSSSIITNSNTGIVNVGSGITIDAKNGNINISGILTVREFSVPINVTSFEPAIGSTSAGITSNIILTFNQVVGFGTTGFFEIRTGLNTTGGTLVERAGIGSAILTLSNGGRKFVVNPTNLLGFGSSFNVTMSNGLINNFSGINTVGTSQTYFFTTEGVGSFYEGGFLICMASPIRWVVSPRCAEISRCWYCRSDLISVTQSCTGCTGWFVPSNGQLQNPGVCCRFFWGPSPCYSSTRYWSDTDVFAHAAGTTCFADGNIGHSSWAGKTSPFCLRAFRCVTY